MLVQPTSVDSIDGTHRAQFPIFAAFRLVAMNTDTALLVGD
jgi:hypothetical protein